MYKTPGFIPDIEKEEDYIFGAKTKLSGEVLLDSGDWRPYVPIMEQQRKNFDTYSCVSFANNNACEIIHKFKYGEEVNYSDRFLSVVSNTIPGRGNSHNNVAEAKRIKGAVAEEIYPFTDSMSENEFFTYPPVGVLDTGIKWFVDYEYGYEKVRKTDFEEALRRGPLQVAVDSRTNRTSQFQGADHSIILVAKDTKYHAYDSYFGRKLEYDLDYPFSFGMRHLYNKVLKITINDMTFKLIRDMSTGKIYLVDSDGKIHHIEQEPDFIELMGQTAWVNKDWMDVPDVKNYAEGVSISAKKVNLFDQISAMFKKLGRKV